MSSDLDRYVVRYLAGMIVCLVLILLAGISRHVLIGDHARSGIVTGDQGLSFGTRGEIMSEDKKLVHAMHVGGESPEYPGLVVIVTDPETQVQTIMAIPPCAAKCIAAIIRSHEAANLLADSLERAAVAAGDLIGAAATYKPVIDREKLRRLNS